MPYTVTVEPQHRLVRVVYSGTITIAERHAAVQEAMRQQAPVQSRRLLIDLSAAIPAAEALDLSNAFATMLATTPLIQDSRLAYVVDPHEHANRLIENLASARHVALRRFHDSDSALRWLLQEGEDTD
jgi:hypothetical protein